MKFPKLLTIGLIFSAAFFSSAAASTTKIANLKAVPGGSELLIQWDFLPENIAADIEGYALQWGESQGAIDITTAPRVTVGRLRNSHALRYAGFEKNRDYYFRAYGYVTEEYGRNKYIMSNGSDILKVRFLNDNRTETEYITPNDPAQTVNQATGDDSGFNFGELRVISFDKTAQFLWSRPNLASGEFSGFKIVLSKKADLTDPEKEFNVGKSMYKTFFEGLTPNTQYYVAGSFYKKIGGGETAFGRSGIKSFKTDPEYTPTQRTRYLRTIKRMQSSGLGSIVTVGTGSTTAAGDTTEIITTPADVSSKADIESRIAYLQKKIRELQSEITSLQIKLGKTPSTTTTSRSVSSGSSLRDRIRAALAARRAARQ